MDEETHGELTRYLLGRMSEAERDRFERAFFEDDDRFEAILSAENDLIDRYVRDELSSVEKAAFESRFMASPKRRARVDAARLLAHELDRAPPERVERQERQESDSGKKPAGSRWRRHLLLVASWSGCGLLGALLAGLGDGWEDRSGEDCVLRDEIHVTGPTRGIGAEDVRQIVLGGEMLTEISVFIADPESFETYRYRLEMVRDALSWEHSGRVEEPAAERGLFFVLRLPVRDLSTGSYRLRVWGTYRPGEAFEEEGEYELGATYLHFQREGPVAGAG